MADPFAAGLAALHSTGASVAADYIPPGGAAMPLRTIHEQPSEIVGGDEPGLVMDTHHFHLRVADVGEPEVDGMIVVHPDGPALSYRINGEPLLDSEGVSLALSRRARVMAGFGVKVELPDLTEVEAAAIEEAGRDVTAAMLGATGFLKDTLRKQVTEAGMGRRLANTWRGETYPKGRTSLEPAGFVWSKAPKIIDAFSRGATIRPVNGSRYLWLPTKNVPRKGRNRKMTPGEVDSLFNAEFVIRPSRKRGVFLALIPVIRAKNNRTWRTASKRRQAQGRAAQLVHMFTLVPNTKMPMRFDLQTAANEAGAFFVRRVSE